MSFAAETVERVSLGQLIKVKHGFAFKGAGFSSEPTPYLLITPGNFAIGGGFQFRPERETYFFGEIPQDYLLSAGDLVVTMTDLSKEGDTLGYPALIPDNPDIAFLHNQRIGLVQVVDPSRSDTRFLYYLMCSREYREEVLASATGSTVKHTAPSRIEAFKFDLPALHRQRAIARILGALDDKIELNRRMNRTLEALAQKLFKSWFVDFDPVVAKSQNRKPFGLSDEVAALFPDTFKDSELGPIPKGWRVDGLGAIARAGRDGISPTSVDPDTPYFGLEHFERKHLAIYAHGKARDVGSGKLRCVQGDLLFGKLRPYFHKVALAPATGVCSTDVMVIKPTESQWRAFLTHHVFSGDFIDHADACSGGTRMPRTEWRDVAAYRVVLPSHELAARFTSALDPFYERMLANVITSRKLAALRDLLLPKLLSGEIRVPVAETEVESVLKDAAT